MTGAVTPATLSVFDAARDEPGRLAIIDGETTLTFEALAGRVARRLAALERDKLLDPNGERPVAFVASPGLATLETLFALLAAGIPAMPLHARLTESEIASLVERAGAKHWTAAATGEHPAAAPPSFDAERIAVLMPTSGSTGAARIARLSHRALVAAARASAAHLGVVDDDRTLITLPLAHVGGLMGFVRALHTRRTVVLFDPQASLLGRLGPLAAELSARRVTQLSMVPTVLDRLLAPELAFTPPESLRAVLVGGAAAPPALLARAHERKIPLLTSYGLTEASAQVATRPYADRFAPPASGPHPLPVGVPLPSVEVRIVDGLIEVRGPTLFSGYVGEPESDPGTGWHRTGDLGFITQRGEVAFSGRASEVIVTGGENVDPVEVEAVLASLPGVTAACVVPLPDPTFGESVAALFVGQAPGIPTTSELFAALATRLARHKCPRRLLAVESLPLLPTGKLDRRRAAELHRSELLALPAYAASLAV